MPPVGAASHGCAPERRSLLDSAQPPPQLRCLFTPPPRRDGGRGWRLGDPSPSAGGGVGAPTLPIGAESRAKVRWDGLMAAVLLYIILLVPFRIGFNITSWAPWVAPDLLVPPPPPLLPGPVGAIWGWGPSYSRRARRARFFFNPESKSGGTESPVAQAKGFALLARPAYGPLRGFGTQPHPGSPPSPFRLTSSSSPTCSSGPSPPSRCSAPPLPRLTFAHVHPFARLHPPPTSTSASTTDFRPQFLSCCWKHAGWCLAFWCTGGGAGRGASADSSAADVAPPPPGLTM